MANIYAHNAYDNVLVLEPREAFQRKFDIGSWREVRLGMFWTMTGLNTFTSSCADETVTQVTKQDILAIGLKDSATSILPGFSGSYFIGVSITGSSGHNVVLGQPGAINISDSTNSSFFGAGFYGTSSYFGGQDLTVPAANYVTETNYSGFYGVRMILNNSGSSSQTVSVYVSSTYNPSVGNTNYYTSSYLNQYMQNATWSTVSTFNWNDGVSAYPIPDSVWIRTPFYFNRLRISAIRLVKYS